jgi:hypothetical protein
VDQISGTTPTDAPVQAHEDSPPADDAAAVEQPGFGSRGRARRRLRFLRKARELAYRDLGGLVYNLHRFGRRNDELVLAKLSTLGQIDSQLRALESSLSAREPVTVLREAGITACPRCAAIHSSEDRFCPNCGLSMARHVDLPIAGAAAAPTSPAPSPSTASNPAQAPQPAPATPQTASRAPSRAPGGAEPAPAEQTPVPAPGAPAAGVPPAPARSAGELQQPEQRIAHERTSPSTTSHPQQSRGGEEATEILRPGAPGP